MRWAAALAALNPPTANGEYHALEGGRWGAACCKCSMEVLCPSGGATLARRAGSAATALRPALPMGGRAVTPSPRTRLD